MKKTLILLALLLALTYSAYAGCDYVWVDGESHYVCDGKLTFGLGG